MPRKSTPYHHGSLESALLDASLALVAERGVAGFTLAAAARAAGVSVAAPYRHFPSKEALLGELARRGFERLGARLRARLERGGDPAETLTDLGLEYVGFAVDDPASFTVMFTVRGRDGQSGPGLAALHPLGEVLAQLDREGRLVTPLDIALRATWSLAHGLATLLLGGARTITEEDSELLRRQILQTLSSGIVR